MGVEDGPLTSQTTPPLLPLVTSLIPLVSLVPLWIRFFLPSLFSILCVGALFLCLILFLRFICLFRMILRSVNRRKMLNLIGKPRLVILFFPVRDLFLGCFICEFRVPSSFFFLFPIRFRISNF